MKISLLLTLLLTISACGKRQDSKDIGRKTGEALTGVLACAVPMMVGSMFTPKIEISREMVEKVEADFQGRPFNREAFWKILSRGTRLDLNLMLASQTKIPEELLYKGIVLFFENHLNNPGMNYHLRTSTYHAIFAIPDQPKATVQTTCTNQDKVLATIDTSNLIFPQPTDLDLYCRVRTRSAWNIL